MDESDILHVKHLIKTYGKLAFEEYLIEIGLLVPMKEEPKQITEVKPK